MNQSGFRVATCNQRQARENVSQLLLILLLIGLEIDVSFADQSRSAEK